MTIENEIPRLEVDAWERRRLRKKQWYIDRGESPGNADDKATNDIRREIRG